MRFGEFSRDVNRCELLALYPEYPVDDPLISSYRARALWEDSNFESHVLAYATLTLEAKYGVPDPNIVDPRFKPWITRFSKV